MAYIHKYVDKATILEWVNVQRSFLREDGIPNIIMDQGHFKVDSAIMKMGQMKTPTRNDSHNFLKMSCSCFILALMCKAKIIAQTSGELLREEFRDIQINYQNTNPLFFFATGTSKSFMDLLPYETLRMYGYAYLRAYVKWSFYKRTGKRFPVAKLAFDKTSRGAFWNAPNSESDVADALYGNILEDSWEYDV